MWKMVCSTLVTSYSSGPIKGLECNILCLSYQILELKLVTFTVVMCIVIFNESAYSLTEKHDIYFVSGTCLYVRIGWLLIKEMASVREY